MRSIFAVAVAAVGLVSAANITDFNIDPQSVDLPERGAWCMGERNTCDTLCPGSPKENTCDIETLNYSCTCNNGTEPGLKYYSSSLYSFVCQEAFKQCTDKNAGNPVELPKCKDEIQAKCGTLDATKLATATDDASSTPTETGASTSSTDASSENSDTNNSGSNDESGASAVLLGSGAAAAAMGMLAFLL
ncbi:hypothetical protein jhhlp_002276 [Lomentospora prolificans]|uniref:DUF7707 domain-containing protein n=1 Tax=Lomentospora prolificans TaxID=41688 RepID=A0A2N3NDM6_9PEZI|nr:hypothetical protein jhhlp_002276 [Lomentospora prolificans]